MPANRIDEDIEHNREHGQTAAQFQHSDPGDMIRASNEAGRRSLEEARQRGRDGGGDHLGPAVDISHIPQHHIDAGRSAMSDTVRQAVTRVGGVAPQVLPHSDMLVDAIVAELICETHELRGRVDTLEHPAPPPAKATPQPSPIPPGMSDDFVEELLEEALALQMAGVSNSDIIAMLTLPVKTPPADTVSGGASGSTSSTTISSGSTAGDTGTIVSGGTVNSGGTVEAGDTANTSGFVDQGGTAGGPAALGGAGGPVDTSGSVASTGTAGA